MCVFVCSSAMSAEWKIRLSCWRFREKKCESQLECEAQSVIYKCHILYFITGEREMRQGENTG